MKFTIITIGTKLPNWAIESYNLYAKRLMPYHTVLLKEIEPIKRTKNINTNRIIEQEGHIILNNIPNKSTIIALDIQGTIWSSEILSQKIKQWQLDSNNNITFIIGGADGLATNCLAKAHYRWSLSLLTLPHAMVRVILIEQLYRACSIITNHPYHR